MERHPAVCILQNKHKYTCIEAIVLCWFLSVIPNYTGHLQQSPKIESAFLNSQLIYMPQEKTACHLVNFHITSVATHAE